MYIPGIYISKIEIVPVTFFFLLAVLYRTAVDSRSIPYTNMRACLNPPPKSIELNRMEYYLPDELVLIGCRHRTDSMQPEKSSFLGRGRTCVGRLFSSSGVPNGPTERAQIKPCLMEIDITVDGGGHVLRTNTLFLCRGVRKRLSFVLIWLARPKILDGPKHDF